MITKTDEGYILRIRVVPNAKRIKVEREADALVFYITAPPVGGKANKELIKLLSSALGIPKRDVQIVRGEKSRDKQILIMGKGALLKEDEIVKLLEQF